MVNPKEFLASLTKKATGFSADEIVEEYSTDAEGNLSLTKRKVTTKYFPPDTTALKSVMEINDLEEMTDEELESERQRLLLELADKPLINGDEKSIQVESE
ncbi:MAG: hypothetical protein RR033_00260 [Clostridia bacterium]